MEKVSTREATKKSRELMEDVRMLQHRYLPPKKVPTTSMPETGTERYKREAVRFFKKEKQNFKYDS